MAKQVFKPLRMTHSAYSRKPEIEKYIVPGSNRDGIPIPFQPFFVPVAAFTLYTSARDYGQISLRSAERRTGPEGNCRCARSRQPKAGTGLGT